MGLVHKVRGRGMFGTDDVQVSVVDVTSAELLAINATPKVLVASPGNASRAVIVENIVMKMVGGTPYTANNAMEVRYTDGSGALLAANAPFPGFLNANNATLYYHCDPLAGLVVANAAVVMRSAANQANGSGTMQVKTYYRVVDV